MEKGETHTLGAIEKMSIFLVFILSPIAQIASPETLVRILKWKIIKVLGRKTLAGIILALILTLFALINMVPHGKAAGEIPTTAHLNVYPSEHVEVNQSIFIVMWVTPAPPTETDVFHGFRVNITQPDRTVYTLGPNTSDRTGTTSVSYTPTQAGLYSAVFFYTGERFNSTGDYYFPSTSSATFVAQIYYNLTLSVTGSGSTNPAPGVLSYPSGTIANITAVPASGWRFNNWLLDGSNVGANPSHSVIMNAAHTLVAIFQENIRPVATIVSINPSSGQKRAFEGETVSFKGDGYDSDGLIVAYKWTSSIDGLLSNSKDFSTASLSVGNHTVYFEVQDNSGAWSVMATQALVVERKIPPIPLSIVLSVIAAGFASSAGAGTFVHYHGKLRSSINIKNKLQKELRKETEKRKKEDTEEKRERDKGNPYLHLETKEFPSRIMEATSYNSELEIKNTGQRQAEGIVVTSDCTPGLLLGKTTAEIAILQCDETRSLTFTLTSSEQLRKGVYMNRFEAKCKDALSRVKTCHTRAVKIGVLSGNKLPKASKQLKDWLRESYVFSELGNADSLMGGLLNYDLLVLTPDLELPRKWIRNISSFVRNGQSLCVIDRIITDEQKLLAEILGYSGIQYELIECDHVVIRICNNEHFVPGEFALGEEIEIGKSWGNFCLSGVKTGKVLAECKINPTNRTQANVDVPIPAVTTNEYGKGKVVHFNFHAEESADRINKILGKTFNWLLS